MKMKAIRSSIACLAVLSFVLSFAATAEEQTPFTGAPISIPGSVQAEYFDNGGEGQAYHDTDAGNNGGYFRATDVDIARLNLLCCERLQEAYIGWTQAGEWLEYTVDVQQEGYYFVEVRVASDGPGGTFHIAFDGIDKTGPLTVPDTGGWRNWRVVAKAAVYLHAGTQVMSLVMDTNGISGSVANIDEIDFSPSVASIPGTVQAERFNEGGEGVAYHDTDAGNNGRYYRATDVDIDVDGDDPFNVSYIGWTKSGEWVEYAVNVQTAGYYTVSAKVASRGQGGTFHIEFNGVDATGMFTVPDTGGWRKWEFISKNGVYLTAGPQVMRLALDSIGPSGSVGNIEHVFFTPSEHIGVVPGLIEAEDFDNGGEGVAYHDTDIGNNGSGRQTDVDLTEAGFYQNHMPNQALGWTQAGEWVQYTVDVQQAGYYRVDARVASKGQGGTFHIELNGVDKTGTFTVPDTGGWSNYSVLSKRDIFLEAGTQSMRIVMDGVGPTGSVGNIDWVRFVSMQTARSPYWGSPADLSVAAEIQAEDFDEGGEGVSYHDVDAGDAGNCYRPLTDVDIDCYSLPGSSAYVGWTQAGEWLEYTVNVPIDGYYQAEISVASKGQGGTFHIEFDRADITGPFAVPNTGGWRNFITLSRSVYLPAGLQVMRIALDSNGPSGSVANLDFVRLTRE
jgi:SOS-response transcriptional repressor LexA